MLVKKALLKNASMVSLVVKSSIKSINSHYNTDQKLAWVHSNTKSKWEEHIRNKLVLVVEDSNQKIIGVGSLMNNEITALYVVSSVQGKGLGFKLLSLLEKEVETKEIFLTASLNSVSFYEKHGYKKIKKEDLVLGEQRIPVIKMKKIKKD